MNRAWAPVGGVIQTGVGELRHRKREGLRRDQWRTPWRRMRPCLVGLSCALQICIPFLLALRTSGCAGIASVVFAERIVHVTDTQTAACASGVFTPGNAAAGNPRKLTGVQVNERAHDLLPGIVCRL